MRAPARPFHHVLLVTMAALVLASVAAVGTLNAINLASVLQARAESRLLRQGRQTVARIGDEIRAHVDWARSLDDHPDWAQVAASDAPPGRLAEWTETWLQHFVELRRLRGGVVSTADGTVVASVGAPGLPDSLAEWPPFTAAVRGETVVRSLRPGDADARYVVLVPVAGGRYVVALSDEMEQVRRVVAGDTGSLEAGSFGVLVDRDWVRVVHGADPNLEGVPLFPLDAAATARLRSDGLTAPRPAPPDLIASPEFAHDLAALRAEPVARPFVVHDRAASDLDRFGVVVPVELTGWTYVLSVPAAYFDRHMWRRVAQSLIVAAPLLLLSLIAATLLARRLARPLGALEAAARAWDDGAHDVSFVVGGSQEVRSLSDAFEAMARRIEAAEQRLEAQVAARTQALDEAHRDLELFTWSASHDLRAPLRVISSFAAILREDHGDALDDDARECLARIERQAGTMNALIDALLALGRAGRDALRPERVDVSALAHAVLREYVWLEPDRDVEVHIEPGLCVWADPTLLKLVLDNLLGNAWKYTARRPRARIDVVAAGREGWTGFTVKDDGAGFDPAHADGLFKPFNRLHSSHEFAGTGIGLVTVQRVVQRHGGELEADGRVNEGATFTVRLPPEAA